MRVTVVTPEQAVAGGNTTTSDRVRTVVERLGHTVGEDGDLLIALHARKSADAIARFDGPVVVVATGTDLYQDPPASTGPSFARARRIVVLHPLAVDALPAEVRGKARVIRQSVVPVAVGPRDPPWTVAVVGHLRAVKDPLAVAEAVGRLPASSRIRVVQVGAALEAGFAEGARTEEGRNPRYRWVGPLAREDALRVLAAAHLLAVPSLLEGGANVVGEALVHGVPVVASRVPGNVGLLGEDWPGLFPAGDREALASLLARWEADGELRADLVVRAARLAVDFAPERELAAWGALLEEGWV